MRLQMVPLLILVYSNVRRHRAAALLSVAAFSIFVGGALFGLTDHVSLGTGLYWAVVTASTVGYGDVTPHNSASRIVSVIVILTVIPTLAAVFALAAGLAAVVQFRRLFGMEYLAPAGSFTVVFGMQPAVPQILEDLIASGRTVVLVAEVHPSEVHHRVQLVAGDPTNEVVIRKSRPERADDALLACPDDGDVLVTCVALRSLAPQLEVFALARSPKIAQALRDLGIERTLSSDELVAHTLAKSLEAPHAGELLLSLIDSERYRMTEVPVGEEMVGRAPGELRLDPPALVLGVLRDGITSAILLEDPQLRQGDVLITLAARPPSS
jgi:voltage-gated potassium channel